ncbi:MAG: group II truncated hemoglobin [Acidimicrobiia bacterium]|nr:group II truncated hemoglobin [Acidimicrobiia bacterium]
MASEANPAANPWGPEPTPYEALGGEDRIRAIVDDFYDEIEREAPTLRAMLPRDDSVSRDKLHAYLVEWTGGPARYTPSRGHPRMRMRHLPFAIGADEVEQWLACMATALDRNGVDGDIRAFLDDRITALAHHMQNQ